MTFHLVAEQVDKHDDNTGHKYAEHDGGQQDDSILRADFTLEEWFVDKFTLVGSSCQRDGVLLTFLKQHKIKARLNVLLTSNLRQHTFGYRSS